MLRPQLTAQAIYRMPFRKIKSFFASLRKPVEEADLPEALFEIRGYVTGGRVPQVVNDRIKLMQHLGFQVTIVPLTEQIPSEHIGRLSYLSGGKSQFRVYLKIQVEHVDKTILVFQRIEQPIQPTFLADHNNTNFP